MAKKFFPKKRYIITPFLLVAFLAIFLFLIGDWQRILDQKRNRFSPARNISQDSVFRSSPGVSMFEAKMESKKLPENPPASQKYWRVPIFTYHYVDVPPMATAWPRLYLRPEVFEEQLKTLKNNYFHPVFAKELANALDGKGTLPENPIVLTFDDGYEDFYTNIFPLLKKYEIKATFFIIVNALDQPNFLTKDQVRELARSGLVEIGSHTLNHANFRKIDDKQAAIEIIDSKKELESILGEKVYTFAYPYGFFGSRDEALVKKAGYIAALSTYPGVMQSKNNIFSLYRLRQDNRFGSDLTIWLENIGK